MLNIQHSLPASNPCLTAFCHGSTILPLPNGDFLAAWFGGTAEGLDDSGIYLARLSNGAPAWGPPVLVSPAEGHPCGNPVLFLGPGDKIWLIYFRVWGAWCTGGKPCARVSEDGGRTWGPERVLLDRSGLLVRNKPIRWGNELLLPVYDELRWTCGITRIPLDGSPWRWDDLSIGESSGVAAIQGSLFPLAADRLLMLMRTKEGHVWRVESPDGGYTWHGLRPTSLPNPNSAIDGVVLPDGAMLLVFNDTDRGRDPMQWDLRYPLTVALSRDGGENWQRVLILETGPGEFSYPAAVIDYAGRVHVVYTWRRREIRHVVLSID